MLPWVTYLRSSGGLAGDWGAAPANLNAALNKGHEDVGNAELRSAGCVSCIARETFGTRHFFSLRPKIEGTCGDIRAHSDDPEDHLRLNAQ